MAGEPQIVLHLSFVWLIVVALGLNSMTPAERTQKIKVDPLRRSLEAP